MIKKKLGLIINPVAGLGGRVGLKGSDGSEVQRIAKALGAIPEAQDRASLALRELARMKESFELWTASGEMGEDCANQEGFRPVVIGNTKGRATTPEDTIDMAQKMAEAGVELLMFAGGDGTARNIYEAIGASLPVVGIPAGVKIHSAVYAVNPKSAGRAACLYLSDNSVNMREAEVMDIDEEAFREGCVNAKLYGYLKVPVLKAYLQNVKSGGYSERESLAGMAAEVADNMEANVLYIMGPGTTTRSVMEGLGLANTLLGVDVVYNKQVLANDVNENLLYEFVGEKRAKIIVTVIGGQGHIFGRGNQQISPRIIRKVGKDNIIVVASRDKLVKLLPAPLLVDTGDPDLDEELCGYVRVITGFEEYVSFKVRA